FFDRNFGGHRPDGSTAIHQNGEDVHSHFFGQSSFSTYVIAHERNVVKVRKDVPLELGATHAVNGMEENAVDAVKRITGGQGVQYSLESTGRPQVLRQAIDALGILGVCGVVGAPSLGTEATFDVNDVMVPGKTVRGIAEGDSVPDVFIPQLIELYTQGRFPFDKLVKFYPFDGINEAAADSEKGGTVKPIIRVSTPA
ncbi:MAG: xylB, partial [Firmicutes bacterium]|nr:xylB [Bacillota bacterium]